MDWIQHSGGVRCGYVIHLIHGCVGSARACVVRWICRLQIGRFCVALGAECGERNLGASLGAGDVTLPGDSSAQTLTTTTRMLSTIQRAGGSYKQQSIHLLVYGTQPESCHNLQSSLSILTSAAKSIMASYEVNHGVCLPSIHYFLGMFPIHAEHLHSS